ncbi:3-deoxy-7-phosphoheptulonate synthase [Longispora sp. NPDC051575]|uniref:3-deoxy-7-phosphoheptulonate synthase n=1 Tax=Longispora sp. NPDC051575 TaxID=3154943 RepID=UPI003444DC28
MTSTAERLVSPAVLRAAVPAPDPEGVAGQRAAIAAVLDGRDRRLLVVVGPCSVHDPDAGTEYARRLAAHARTVEADLLVVMRAYLEKPRTVVGWTGMVNDPGLDGSGDLDAGLSTARRFLAGASAAGVPLAYEFVDPMLAGYLSDLVSWGAIGARTVQSQPHRLLASALPMPVGFKNPTSGDVRGAVQAVQAAGSGHVFPAMGDDGEPTVVRSGGNPHGHVILRGGDATGPNYDADSVGRALDLLDAAGLPRRVVVDASHGNSGKDHHRQRVVLADLAGQVAGGSAGIAGVMVESFLEAGAQPIDNLPLVYGRSVTDACLGWSDTEEVLDDLARAARARRLS